MSGDKKNNRQGNTLQIPFILFTYTHSYFRPTSAAEEYGVLLWTALQSDPGRA